MSFNLPEEDVEFLEGLGIKYELLAEAMPNGTVRRGVFLPGFVFAGNLGTQKDGAVVPCDSCDLVILIPDGYATTKLDSFYTLPRLKRADGADPHCANGESALFGKTWQFWSRHLDDKDWRVGIDGLRTFFHYVRTELRSA
jgi:Prokaryotic E2 family E